ncbi:hypothetical protein PtA15_13A314 [Puccinia triticina]|uniref:Uncharacterized protein n=1 Tax=Puccinia triticina TaxID=208348 RepID=A0ABY7D011_9BASI|nr:uncharacterized protein PtA15_13A314 [Puccinia triticina]WAQ90914.1 hypothetical protein PtA15_13A314 [Puccinia triticina]
MAPIAEEEEYGEETVEVGAEDKDSGTDGEEDDEDSKDNDEDNNVDQDDTNQSKVEINSSFIDQILKEEFDKHVAKKSRARQTEKSRSGHFKEIVFDANNWSAIKELNDELEIFAVMTKEMEGDGSTGALVLPKYHI